MTIQRKLSQLPSYSQELGLDLAREQHRFKWFLASILFVGGTSPQIAKKTYRQFEKEGIVTPESIIEAGWDRLVEVLDAGGYVVYDFATASKLLEIASRLKEKYGSLENLYVQAKNDKDLEKKLQEFKGVGPTTVNTFLRELKGTWEKARPSLSPVAREVASRLGLDENYLERPQVEAALVRIGLEFCKNGQCSACPVRKECSRPS
jgi:endonuclease III